MSAFRVSKRDCCPWSGHWSTLARSPRAGNGSVQKHSLAATSLGGLAGPIAMATRLGSAVGDEATLRNGNAQ
eukprot:5541163-Lingulodinium_polyedra.AAC.1